MGRYLYSVPEIQITGSRAVYDFVDAAGQVHPGFTDYWANHLRRLPEEEMPSLYEIVQLFRDYKMTNSSRSKQSTLKGKGQEKDSGTNKHGYQAPYRNEPGEKKRSCICGKPHFYERCYYLIDSIRPRNWTPDPEIQKKADEILDSKPRIRAAVEAVQHKTKRTGSGMEKERKDGTPLMACVVSGTGVGNSTYSTTDQSSDYPLRDSFILDSGATTHVCT